MPYCPIPADTGRFLRLGRATDYSHMPSKLFPAHCRPRHLQSLFSEHQTTHDASWMMRRRRKEYRKTTHTTSSKAAQVESMKQPAIAPITLSRSTIHPCQTQGTGSTYACQSVISQPVVVWLSSRRNETPAWIPNRYSILSPRVRVCVHVHVHVSVYQYPPLYSGLRTYRRQRCRRNKWLGGRFNECK